MKDEIIKVKDFSIAYQDVNKDKKETLLFIHGNSLSYEVFQQQLSATLLSNYRLIAIDLPGHGRSSKSISPLSEYTVPFYATIIDEIIEELQLDQVVLIGHSLGGHIAIEVAGRYPNAISGLVICGTPPLAIPADTQSAFLPNPSAGLLFQSELNTEEMKNLVLTIAKDDKKNVLFTAVENSDKLVRSCVGASIAAANYADEIEILNTTVIPFAILLGENDAFCNPNYFEKYPFKNQWRNKIQIIPSGSHTPFMNNAEEVNVLLNEFANITFTK